MFNNTTDEVNTVRNYFSDTRSLALFDVLTDKELRWDKGKRIKGYENLRQFCPRLLETFSLFAESTKIRKIFVWGGGGRLKEILNSGDMEFIKFNFPKFNGFAGIIDNNIVLNEKYGLPVMSYDGFKSQFPNDIVIISIYDYITADSIRRTLLNDNIPCVIFRDLIDITKRQYFDFFYDEGLFIDDEVFVHAGCWDGYTQKWFTEYVGNKYKKMITFEPSSAYENCKIALSGLRDVNVINAGLGDKNKSLAFTEKVDFLVSAHFSESGERSVNIVTLDDFLKNEKVTFIALDVEGFEMAVLRGAYRIITKQRPKLAISVYHKLEDIIEIPKYIKKLNQEYKLALRSYGVNTFCDTICYAW